MRELNEKRPFTIQVLVLVVVFFNYITIIAEILFFRSIFIMQCSSFRNYSLVVVFSILSNIRPSEQFSSSAVTAWLLVYLHLWNNLTKLLVTFTHFFLCVFNHGISPLISPLIRPYHLQNLMWNLPFSQSIWLIQHHLLFLTSSLLTNLNLWRYDL